MPATATIGLGTTLSVNSSTPASVTKIDGPGISMGTVEVTHLGSTMKEYLPTIADGGDIVFTILYDRTESTHQDLETLVTDGDVVPCVVTYTRMSSKTISFNGIVTNFKVGGVEPEGVVSADVTIKITSALTFSS